MALTAIFAQLSCSRLEESIGWFTQVFGRDPDARPMPGLAEWHEGQGAGFQLFEAADHAGHGTLTLIVSDVASDRARLVEAGLEPGPVEAADYTSICRMRDPDSNLVVLAQPTGA
ncbi:VOC family protein [Sphingobium aromaticiconvertens]|uniref:VOC family protein n=1 Tax=Sphingobium aromaticiconvertens TaxID=365341 RepID=UPI003019DD39